MLIDLTAAEAKKVHLWADRELQYLRNPIIWLKTREEWEEEVALTEGIIARCEQVIRAAGEWEEHVRRVEWLRGGR